MAHIDEREERILDPITRAHFVVVGVVERESKRTDFGRLLLFGVPSTWSKLWSSNIHHPTKQTCTNVTLRTCIQRISSNNYCSHPRMKAILFPGQGSQSIGMLQKLYRSNGTVRSLVDEAHETLLPSGVALRDIMWNGQMVLSNSRILLTRVL